MKTLEKIKIGTCCLVLVFAMTGCQNEDIVDFGFDGSFKGTLKDPNGSIVPGSITSAGLIVRALGAGDEVTTDMRIKGDGTYQNTKLYPKEYKIWVSGPVALVTDTLVIDFSKEKSVTQDLVVTPFISISRPVVTGNPTSTTVDVDYDLSPNDGKVVSKRELYCSTNPYPETNTGSGPFYHTIKVSLNADAGTANVTGLTPGTKYYIRIGAQANGASAFNYSEQIVITTQ